MTERYVGGEVTRSGFREPKRRGPTGRPMGCGLMRSQAAMAGGPQEFA